MRKKAKSDIIVNDNKLLTNKLLTNLKNNKMKKCKIIFAMVIFIAMNISAAATNQKLAFGEQTFRINGKKYYTVEDADSTVFLVPKQKRALSEGSVTLGGEEYILGRLLGKEKRDGIKYAVISVKDTTYLVSFDRIPDTFEDVPVIVPGEIKKDGKLFRKQIFQAVSINGKDFYIYQGREYFPFLAILLGLIIIGMVVKITSKK